MQSLKAHGTQMHPNLSFKKPLPGIVETLQEWHLGHKPVYWPLGCCAALQSTCATGNGLPT